EREAQAVLRRQRQAPFDVEVRVGEVAGEQRVVGRVVVADDLLVMVARALRQIDRRLERGARGGEVAVFGERDAERELYPRADVVEVMLGGDARGFLEVVDG